MEPPPLSSDHTRESGPNVRNNRKNYRGPRNNTQQRFHNGQQQNLPPRFQQRNRQQLDGNIADLDDSEENNLPTGNLPQNCDTNDHNTRHHKTNNNNYYDPNQVYNRSNRKNYHRQTFSNQDNNQHNFCSLSNREQISQTRSQRNRHVDNAYNGGSSYQPEYSLGSSFRNQNRNQRIQSGNNFPRTSSQSQSYRHYNRPNRADNELHNSNYQSSSRQNFNQDRQSQNINSQNVRNLPDTFRRLKVHSNRKNQTRSNLNSIQFENGSPNTAAPKGDSDNTECSDNDERKNEEKRTIRANLSTTNGCDKLETQRDIMDELLRKEEYECLVCCEFVRQVDRTWNCSNCFNIFHLNCIKSWAQSLQIPKEQTSEQSVGGRVNKKNQKNDWRCPICQAIKSKMPNIYLCYCSKRKDPELNRYLVPHSCGDPCGRSLKLFNMSEGESDQYFSCPHKCTSLCHPGKCAPCKLKMERTCACQQTKMYLNCVSKKSLLECENICNKTLNCSRHQCGDRCHFGDCRTCDVKFDIKCFCGAKVRQEQVCTSDLEMAFTCESICGKKLSCGNHFCQDICHPGSCGECLYLPKNVKTCHCGQTNLSDLKNSFRKTCLDPIPVCNKTCNKQLTCGSENNPHLCESKCHTGNCPVCKKSSIIKCECGANSQKLDCKDMKSWRFKCKRRCNKKLQCGRHKCLQECCIIQNHTCNQVCGKKLDCGKHHCEENCHNYCQSCPNVIWEEIFCNCGAEVLYPPQPCGTGKPPCNRECSRPHPCGHRQNHNCHDDENCPPCVEMVSRRCAGDHEVVQNVYCYQLRASCGRQCSKALPCGMHRCMKSCHAGDCSQCNQKCTKLREICQHPCASPCHVLSSSTCPKSQCLEYVKVYCECKFHQEILPCYQARNPKRYQSLLEAMMKKYQFNRDMNYESIVSLVRDKLLNYLECDEECSKNKRTQQLAEAFGITAKDVIQESKYTEFLKNETRANPEFVYQIHEKCISLINDFKKKNVRQLSYNFAPMNRINRQIVHHYAESMGLKTESIDQEPNRSVMIKATKLSEVPARSILQVLGIDVKKLIKPREFVVTAKTASEEQAMRKKVVIDYFND